MSDSGHTKFDMVDDSDASDLIEVTSRWLRDVRIRAMNEAMIMVDVKYKQRIELLGDRFPLGDRALGKIISIKRPAIDDGSDSSVKQESHHSKD